MAISATHYRLLRLLAKERQIFPPKPSILEIGEANWYGDADPKIILEDADPADRAALEYYINVALQQENGLYDIAKLVYKVLLGTTETAAFDLDGTRHARLVNLNYPTLDHYTYDVVYNHGTLEHIFDIAQALKTIHDACVVGGLMIHEAPFHGWLDHGFYNLQPTLFYDLADANNYEVVAVFLEHIEGGITQEVYNRDQMHELIQHKHVIPGMMLFVVLRKQHNRPFAKPMQAVYDKRLSEAGNQTWREAR